VLDSGASGFVITPTAAAALGLDAFGELYATSLSGKVRIVPSQTGFGANVSVQQKWLGEA
jgi:hypothetical protein